MTKAYSVRVASVEDISPKAVRLTAFDGSSDIFPKSAIFGEDLEVTRYAALWVAAWILPKKELQFSTKKVAFFGGRGQMRRFVVQAEEHKPERVAPAGNNEIDELRISR